MANNILQFTINLNGNAYTGIAQIDRALNKVSVDASKTTGLLERLNSAAFKINNIFQAMSTIVGTVTSTMSAFEQANSAQIQAETKLATVMRNTMAASDAEIASIKELASAQQRLGVIGDEVQLAGAQELGTYLGKTETLQKLIPVMNDMVAQQYGLNASQESAVNIATMMGKVMDGQVGALSRYGYKFTEAQAQILKFGTEEQRAATLADVVSSAVGGVNEALAQTPEGRMRQVANSIGDMRERVGALYVRVQNALLPAIGKILQLTEKAISLIESKQDVIVAVVTDVANAFSGLLSFLRRVYDFITDTLPIWMGMAGAIAAVTIAVQAQNIALQALIVWEGVVKTATTLWAGAQAVLNAVMTANPIGLIIAGIVALVGVIIYLCNHITGLGKLWDGVVSFMKFSFYAFVDAVKLYFDTYINGFLMGLDKIKLGWYKFKEECGLGDSDENRAAIESINADIEKRQKAISDGAKSVLDNALKAKNAITEGFSSLGWKSGNKSESAAAALGVNDQLIAATNSGGGGMSLNSLSQESSKATEAVATGGTRNTEVHINIGDMIRQVTFSGTVSENKNDIEKTFAECLYQVLGMVQTSI